MFSKKSKNDKKMEPSSAYPQQPLYPTQPQYPTQPSAPTAYSAGPHMQQNYGPPPYPGQAQAAYPPGPPMAQGGPPPPPYSYYPSQPHVPPPNPGYPVQPGFQFNPSMAAPATFDSGARFDGISTQRIPPPPPGVAPNGAQMAVAQGAPVFATQKKSNWFSGNGGGVSFW